MQQTLQSALKCRLHRQNEKYHPQRSDIESSKYLSGDHFLSVDSERPLTEEELKS